MDHGSPCFCFRTLNASDMFPVYVLLAPGPEVPGKDDVLQVFNTCHDLEGKSGQIRKCDMHSYFYASM